MRQRLYTGLPNHVDTNTCSVECTLQNVIFAIHWLLLQLCRVAYELMQTHHADASLFFKSLDDFYYFHGQHPHLFEAVESHTAKHKDEISFSKGQMIDVLGNHWNGYSKGKNIETGEEGLFPSYKVVDKLRIVTYPDQWCSVYYNTINIPHWLSLFSKPFYLLFHLMFIFTTLLSY